MKKNSYETAQGGSLIHWALGVPAFVWQISFFYLPLCLLLVKAFSFPGSGFSFVAFSPFFSSCYLSIFCRSFGLALATVLCCSLLAYPLAYCFASAPNRIKPLLIGLFLVPFWTNFLLHVFAWFFVLEQEGVLNLLLLKIGLIKESLPFLNSFGATLLMMVYYYFPLMVLPIYSSLSRLNPRIIEASYALGASWGKTFVKITLPLTKRAIKLGFLLIYIPAFMEFVIPELIGGNRMAYAGTVVSMLMLQEGTVNLGCAFTVLTMAVVLLSAYLLCKVIDYCLPTKTAL